MKILVIVLICLLLIGLSLLTYCLITKKCTKDPGVGEPRVWHILGDGGGAENFHILFLGDGFATDIQLEAYRAAVHQLAAGLISREPFSDHAGQLEFYRIDVKDRNDQFPDTECPENCATLQTLDASLPLAPAPAPLAQVEGGTDTTLLDLGATRCWTASGAQPAVCYVFWTGREGLDDAYELSQRLPDPIKIEIVVVVVNAEEYAGGGLYDVNLAVDRMVFVAVDLEPAASGTESQVSDSAHLLFAHEMGHAMGLLDEYQSDSSPPDEPPIGRNVWNPESTQNPGGYPPIAVAGPSWRSLLPGSCDPFDMVPCCGGPGAISGCDACDGIDPSGCHKVPAICQDSMWFCINPLSTQCEREVSCQTNDFDADVQCAPDACGHEDTVGAWEGAVYSRQGYFRASRTCRMRELHDDFGFCLACRLHLKNKFGSRAALP